MTSYKNFTTTVVGIDADQGRLLLATTNENGRAGKPFCAAICRACMLSVGQQITGVYTEKGVVGINPQSGCASRAKLCPESVPFTGKCQSVQQFDQITEVVDDEAPILVDTGDLNKTGIQTGSLGLRAAFSDMAFTFDQAAD